VPRRQWDNYHAAAATSDFGRAYNRIFTIVTALYDYVWLQKLYELQRSVLAKDDDEIDLLNGRKDVGTLAFTAYRSSRTL
jgi:hypothetical protein